MLASLAGGCLPEVSARARPGPEGVLRLRNRTDEPVCYVHIDPAGVSRDASESEDRLLPSEVVLPGEERDFEVTRGGFRVRLLDCARRVLWANALLEIDDGVILELWLRRGGERSR